MEITNRSLDYKIPLVVGERVAQIIFFKTGSVHGSYKDKGNYQTTNDLEELKRNWKPEMMLPRTQRSF